MSADGIVRCIIPCEVFTVDVTLGNKGLTPLERLVLEAIASDEGLNSLDLLVDFFKLGHRPTFILLADLWRSGYLFVDVVQGIIHLPAPIKDLVKNNQLDQLNDLPGSHQTTKVFGLCQELVAGNILPIIPNQNPSSNKYIRAPQLLEFGSYREVPLAAIKEAANQIIDRNRRPDNGVVGRQQIEPGDRVLHANLRTNTYEGKPLALKQRVLEIQAHVAKSRGGAIRLSIQQPNRLSERARLSLEETLSKVALERPEEPLVQHFLDNAVPEEEEKRPPLKELLAELDKKITSIAITENDPQRQHARLSDLADGARAGILQRWQEQAQVRLIHDAEALAKTIEDEIKAASSQIIMACPRLSHEGLGRYRDAIKAALERGVQVFFLWGANVNEKIPDPVLRIFEVLRKYGDLYLMDKAARINERYFIRDWQTAIVTSAPYLEARRPGDFALAFEIKRPADRSDCKLVTDQLGRLYRLAPDPGFIKKLSITQSGTAEAASQLVIPNLPSGPFAFNPEQWQEDNKQLTTASLTLWKNNWKQWVAGLQQRMSQIGDTATLVHNGEHRDLLLQALAEAKKFVLVASERLSAQGFNQELEEALVQAMSKGVAVHVLYGNIDPKDEPAQARLKKLAALKPSGLHKLQVPCHGGLLLSEDYVMVTSFSLLSKSGYDKSQGRLGVQYETGILARSRNLVQQTMALLPQFQTTSPMTPQPPARPEIGKEKMPSAGETAPMSAPLTSLLNELRHLQLSPENSNEAVPLFRSRFKQAAEDKNGFDLLKELLPLLPADLQELAVANCLKAYGPPKTDDFFKAEYEHWLSWLALAKWHERKFMEAALLWNGCPPGDRQNMPPAWLVELTVTAQVDAKLFEEKLLEAVYQPNLREVERVSVACLACEWLGFQGLEIARDVLAELGKDTLPAPLNLWAADFIAFWDSTHQPLPTETLVFNEKIEQTRAVAEENYTELKKSFQQSALINPGDHIFVRLTWQHIFKPGGAFGYLGDSINKKDIQAVKKWLKDNQAILSNLSRFLDEAAFEALSKDYGLVRIIGPTRNSRLNKLLTLRKAIEEWVKYEPVVIADRAAVEETVRLARQLLTGLKNKARQLDELIKTWKNQRFYQAAPARQLLEKLDPYLGKY